MPHVKARNLTQKRFDMIEQTAISEEGDIVFTNSPLAGVPPQPEQGVYLIPKREIEKDIPIVTLLREVEAYRVVWSPDGKQIAYDVPNRSIYTYNLETRSILKVKPFGEFPTFSPDSKKLAYAGREPRTIYITSLENLDDTQTIAIDEKHTGIRQLKWSPDGQYIIYTTPKHTFAAPVNGGPHIKLFDQFTYRVSNFHWVSPKAYPVESTSRLTTIWAQLKAHNIK